MHYNQYNNYPMGIGSVLARNPEARMNFALATQEEQTALIDSCTHCKNYEEMYDLVTSQSTQNQLEQDKAHVKHGNKNEHFQGTPYSF